MFSAERGQRNNYSAFRRRRRGVVLMSVSVYGWVSTGGYLRNYTGEFHHILCMLVALRLGPLLAA